MPNKLRGYDHTDFDIWYDKINGNEKNLNFFMESMTIAGMAHNTIQCTIQQHSNN